MNLVEAVASKVPVDDREAAAQARFLAELDRLERPTDELADPVHVTASAIIVGRRGTVLHLHRRLGRWLQPGGHVEAGEEPPAAAVREAVEETGLAVTHPDGVPRLIHLDVHDAAKGHTHLDLRYLVVGPDADPAAGAPREPGGGVVHLGRGRIGGRRRTARGAARRVGDRRGLRVMSDLEQLLVVQEPRHAPRPARTASCDDARAPAAHRGGGRGRAARRADRHPRRAAPGARRAPGGTRRAGRVALGALTRRSNSACWRRAGRRRATSRRWTTRSATSESDVPSSKRSSSP